MILLAVLNVRIQFVSGIKMSADEPSEYRGKLQLLRGIRQVDIIFWCCCNILILFPFPPAIFAPFPFARFLPDLENVKIRLSGSYIFPVETFIIMCLVPYIVTRTVIVNEICT